MKGIIDSVCSSLTDRKQDEEKRQQSSERLEKLLKHIYDNQLQDQLKSSADTLNKLIDEYAKDEDCWQQDSRLMKLYDMFKRLGDYYISFSQKALVALCTLKAPLDESDVEDLKKMNQEFVNSKVSISDVTIAIEPMRQKQRKLDELQREAIELEKQTQIMQAKKEATELERQTEALLKASEAMPKIDEVTIKHYDPRLFSDWRRIKAEGEKINAKGKEIQWRINERMERVFKKIEKEGRFPKDIAPEDKKLFDDWFSKESRRLAHEKWKQENHSRSEEPYGGFTY